GNGPLLLLARERAAARGVGLELHGVDLADIDPVHAIVDGERLYAGIRFHPRTSACELPFADGEVDMLCSQFGFEYAPREQAVAELLRVARPRARIALVVHSDDSIVARASVEQRKGCAFLRPSPAIAPAPALVPVLCRAAPARPGAWPSTRRHRPCSRRSTRCPGPRSCATRRSRSAPHWNTQRARPSRPTPCSRGCTKACRTRTCAWATCRTHCLAPANWRRSPRACGSMDTRPRTRHWSSGQE